MAISWGAYEGGMRVGIEVDWEPVDHGEATATAQVRIYTDNSQSFSDNQTLNYSGSISGSTNYTNNSSGTSGAVHRATREYNYNYGASEYGSSPGNRTFTASASGLYTGGTPSKSVSSAIPARPIAAPVAPTNAAAARISDTTTRITWTRNSSAARPVSSHWLYQSTNGGAFGAVTTGISGGASSYDRATAANNKYRFRVYADNSAGTSAYDETGDIYTTPSPPTAIARADITDGQRITWTKKTGYTEFSTEIIGYKNGVSVGVLGTVASGATQQFDHLTSHATQPYTTTDRWKYVARHRTTAGTQGTLYSVVTAYTTETAGVTSQPNAPTNLSPNGVSADPLAVIPLTWVHNPTDGSAQTEYQVRHRLVGAGAWTTLAAVASSVKQHNLAANTYVNGDQVEWQVSTKGADAAFSSFSASATFTAAITKRVPLYLDLGTGRMEADLTGFDWKTFGAAGQPALQNGWVTYGSPYGTLRFCRRNGIVYVQGLVKDGTLNSTIATLPAGYRPGQQLLLPAVTNAVTTGGASAGTAHTHILNQQAGRIDIKTNGEIAQSGASANAWVSVFASFPADL